MKRLVIALVLGTLAVAILFLSRCPVISKIKKALNSLCRSDSSASVLENFDDLWKLGNPVEVEKEFRKLIPLAKMLQDSSLYLQLLSQIALTQAMQKHFDNAYNTLDEAEKLLTSEQRLARVRIFLERGRVFQQVAYTLENPSGSLEMSQARLFFEKAFAFSSQGGFDLYTINAAHMVAIAVTKIEDKIKWNELAIELAQKTRDSKARAWLGSLYHNLGQNFLEASLFEQALPVLKKALKCREQEGYAPNVRVAKWTIGRTLRLLGRFDEALVMQEYLLREYVIIAKTGSFGMPEEMFKLTRALVYEELAEIYDAKAKKFADLAYNDLSQDLMFKKFESVRLEKLKTRLSDSVHLCNVKGEHV